MPVMRQTRPERGAPEQHRPGHDHAEAERTDPEQAQARQQLGQPARCVRPGRAAARTRRAPRRRRRRSPRSPASAASGSGALARAAPRLGFSTDRDRVCTAAASPGAARAVLALARSGSGLRVARPNAFGTLPDSDRRRGASRPVKSSRMRKLAVALMLACAGVQPALGETLIASALTLGIRASHDHAHSLAWRSDGSHLDIVLSHGESRALMRRTGSARATIISPACRSAITSFTSRRAKRPMRLLVARCWTPPRRSRARSRSRSLPPRRGRRRVRSSRARTVRIT